MPLNKNTLRNAILAAFETAKEEEWEADEVAQALADAIDAFVRSGDVAGVDIEIETLNGNPANGSGTQAGVVHLT